MDSDFSLLYNVIKGGVYCLKICLHCKQEKPDNCYGMFKNRDGTKGYRNVCKTCQNKQRKGGSQISGEQNKPERMIYIMLSDEQIKKLENLANKHDDILEMLGDRLDLWNIEDIKVNRTQKTIMINTELDKIITEHMKKSRLSYSDIANISLKRGLEFIK